MCAKVYEEVPYMLFVLLERLAEAQNRSDSVYLVTLACACWSDQGVVPLSVDDVDQ